MSESPGREQGPIRNLLGSVTGVLATVVDIGRTRLELLSTELQEEVQSAAELLIWSFIALFAAGIALFLGALVLIFAFWDTHRVLVSVLVTSFFVLIAVFAALMLRARLKGRGRPFEATLSELVRDGEELRSRFDR